MKTKPDVREKKKAEVMFFPNGNTMVFVDRKQYSKAQGSWLLEYVKKLEKAGIDVLNSTYKMPNESQATLIKTDNGYNWKF